MSRTHKDAPRHVRERRGPMVAEHHHCKNSTDGGRWVSVSTPVEHPAAWHAETVYDLDCCAVASAPRTREASVHHLAVVHGLGRFRAADVLFLARKSTGTVFGPRVELRTEHVWQVRACDLDDGRGGRTYNTCRMVPARYDRLIYPGGRPRPDEINLAYYSPERAHVRDTLRAAAAEHNASGGSDIEPVARQTRRSTWYGGYWD